MKQRTTQGLCGTCKRLVDVDVITRDGAVYFDKTCPAHGQST